MKYLTTYKLFESIEDRAAAIIVIEETKADIRDIFQEAEDMGLYVNVSFEVGVPNVVVDGRKLSQNFMSVYVTQNSDIEDKFKFDDISLLVKHLISYMNSIGYEWCVFNTENNIRIETGVNSGYTSSITLPNYNKPIKIFNIQFKKFELIKRLFESSSEMDLYIRDILLEVTDLGLSVEVRDGEDRKNFKEKDIKEVIISDPDFNWDVNHPLYYFKDISDPVIQLIEYMCEESYPIFNVYINNSYRGAGFTAWTRNDDFFETGPMPGMDESFHKFSISFEKSVE